MGRLAGPFDVPTPINVMISTLGVVPKKTPGEYRLIHDLSFPKFNSVNSHINKFHTEVSYELIDHCITIIQAIGPKCLIAKADIKDAFRIIPFGFLLGQISFIMIIDTSTSLELKIT